jgi:hypothetical protein
MAICPGVFHSVREVLNDETHRDSISGWLHRPDEEMNVNSESDWNAEQHQSPCDMNGVDFKGFASKDCSEEITLTEEDCQFRKIPDKDVFERKDSWQDCN